jgi:glycerophosphoryl diester phosphodiesterase
MLRVGHKGADSIRTGNTIESFEAAVGAGVDMIELDVLRPRADFADHDDWRRAEAGPVSEPGGPLLVAHDWGDARRRRPLELGEALDAFAAPPLAEVRIDLDLKLAGREDEVVAALRERGLVERAAASTMELSSIRELRRLAPELRLGWTVPKISRDWNAIPWAKPLVLGGLASLRLRLPGIVRRRAPQLGVASVWAYHPVITKRLVRACRGARIELIAWTVDDLAGMRRLSTLGVDGICTNDPRLFTELRP